MAALEPPQLALLGGREPWPLAGHVRGSLADDGVAVAWVGRIAAEAGPEEAWRCSRNLDRALRRGGVPTGTDRGRALTALWARVDTIAEDALGPAGGRDLVLFLAARDPDGIALSGVGLAAVLGERDGVIETWIGPPHPMLGPPGRPANRPGALAVAYAPPFLIATTEGSPDVDGVELDWVLPRCGVHG